MAFLAVRALLLSGGLDSTALAYWLRPDLTLTVDYGQAPAAGEIRAASIVSSELGIPHEVVAVDASSLGAGPLASSAPIREDMPLEWWPYRNQMLVTFAAMQIAGRGFDEILIGTVSDDSRHSDGTPEFVAALDQLLSIQIPYTRLKAPAVRLTPAELLDRSRAPMSLLGWTISCHRDPEGCGDCPGCARHFERVAAYEASLQP
jgi:7-cyano-7-deazaguanine synthase